MSSSVADQLAEAKALYESNLICESLWKEKQRQILALPPQGSATAFLLVACKGHSLRFPLLYHVLCYIKAPGNNDLTVFCAGLQMKLVLISFCKLH